MEDGKFKITFPAEIKQVQSRKLASLDLEFKLTLVTSDAMVLQLGALNPEMLVDVEVRLQDE